MPLDTLAPKVIAIATRAQALEDTWTYSRSAGGWFEDKAAYEALMTEALSVVEHIYGRGHAHHQRIAYWYNQHSLEGLRAVRGILTGVAANIENGFLTNLAVKAAIEISTEFLATASVFVETGDKDQEFSVVVNSLLVQRVIEKSTHAALQSFRPLRNAAFHAQWHEVSL